MADNAEVEVSRLRLPPPLSALDLYTMSKSRSEDVPWGSRPSKGMAIDGLRAITYTYSYAMDAEQSEDPVYFNNYIVDGLNGWIISCRCKQGELVRKTYLQYKPLFQRIARMLLPATRSIEASSAASGDVVISAVEKGCWRRLGPTLNR